MAKPRIRDLPDWSDLAHPGAELEVRVTPKATRNALTRNGNELRAAVTAAPENGKANAAVRSLLAAALGVAPSRITLKRGQTSRTKTFLVAD